MYYYIFSWAKFWTIINLGDPIENKEEAIELARHMTESNKLTLGKDIKVMELRSCGRNLKDIQFIEVEI